MQFNDSHTDLATEISETGWSQKIETGIEVLDEQHRRYFDLVNSFLASARQAEAGNDGTSVLVEQLGFLRRYAIEHFATEQKIMKESGYDGFQQHFDEHMYFLKHVGGLYKQLEEGGHSEKLTREVYYYTLEWFIGHILNTDMKVVEFLRQKDT